MSIAEPYCNWTLDKEVNKPPELLIRNITGIIGIASFIAMPTAGLIMKLDSGGIWFPTLFATSIISLIVSSNYHSKLSSAPIRCSLCKQNMSHTQHDYPKITKNAGLNLLAPVIKGANGRHYIRVESSGSKGYSTTKRWCRVMQELRICKQCKRYIVISEKKLVRIGTSEKDVEEYEAKLIRMTKALAGKKIRLRRK